MCVVDDDAGILSIILIHSPTCLTCTLVYAEIQNVLDIENTDDALA
jgi:hypothetical protein